MIISITVNTVVRSFDVQPDEVLLDVLGVRASLR